MGRPPCCDKSNVKKGLWTAEEDAKILHYVSTNGPGNWTSVPKKAGLKRCGKSCRLRWTNYLRPDLKHDNFTPEEEELIVKLHRAIGSRWSLIAMQLPGRTDNDVKNHWNTKLRKKLFGVGIDPVTHKPFSQILSDYGNIGGLLKNTAGGARIGGSHSRDMKNAFMLKPDNQPSLMIPQLDGYPNIANQSIMTIGITPIQEYNPFININNNQSLELLAQLQAINMTTHQASPIKQEIHYYQPNFFYEGSSSSSSSSSSNLGQENNPTVPVIPVQTTTPGSSFSWREFLLEDAFLPSIQQDLQYGFSSTDSSSQIITPNELNSAGGDTNQQDRGVYPVKNLGESSGASSSNDISFIEALLDRDSQLRLECPNLLEEPFY